MTKACRPPRRFPLGVQILLLVAAILLVGCSESEVPQGAEQQSPALNQCRNEFDAANPVTLIPKVLKTLDHDTSAYTQGLLIYDGEIIETTGRVGESEIRRLDRQTGALLEATPLPDDVFGEGVTVLNDAFWQVTWQDERAFKWAHDVHDGFVIIEEFTYEGEGWGLVTLESSHGGNDAGYHNGTDSPQGLEMWMSNGSDRLTRLDPITFAQMESHAVTRSGGDADQLNELEWDGTWLWANRFLTNEILRIDPDCFQVSGVVDGDSLTADAQAIAEANNEEIDVMNGIAFDPMTNTYLLTGKWWPTMYEVEFGEK